MDSELVVEGTLGKVKTPRPMKGGRSRVLLREPEMCAECGKVYVSLYQINSCSEHDGLDRV